MGGLVQQLFWLGLGLDWVVCLHFVQIGLSAVCLCLCLVWPLVQVGLAGVQLGPG